MASKRAAKKSAPAEPAPVSDEPEALRLLAEEAVRKAGEALRQVELPTHVEPSFVFRP